MLTDRQIDSTEARYEDSSHVRKLYKESGIGRWFDVVGRVTMERIGSHATNNRLYESRGSMTHSACDSVDSADTDRKLVALFVGDTTACVEFLIDSDEGVNPSQGNKKGSETTLFGKFNQDCVPDKQYSPQKQYNGNFNKKSHS